MSLQKLEDTLTHFGKTEANMKRMLSDSMDIYIDTIVAALRNARVNDTTVLLMHNDMICTKKDFVNGFADIVTDAKGYIQNEIDGYEQDQKASQADAYYDGRA